jgi:SAM-dependent methyltransferase
VGPAAQLYSSDELDAMALAENYCRWIVDQWRPYLRGRVLELGAGTGNFSRFLLQESIESLLLVEPAHNLFETLQARLGGDRRAAFRCGTLEDFRQELRDAPVDVAVSVNVLEHIPDDLRVLRGLKEVVVPGGTVLLLVPALPLLYGAADETFGHVRRYTRAGLSERLQAAGLSIATMHYFNFLGAFAWFTAGRLLRRRTVTPAMVKVSDATLIPLTRLLERLVVPPFGQSLIAVARA